MRNWNSLPCLHLQHCFSVFTVPMRNWNFLPFYLIIEFSMCFYSTYEELKHSFLFSGPNCGSCFYSTYEELKLHPFLFADPVYNCFYSTYEELKQTIFKGIFDAVIGFLQYLWGIETSNWKPFNYVIKFVFTVPMRNWNWLFSWASEGV